MKKVFKTLLLVLFLVGIASLGEAKKDKSSKKSKAHKVGWSMSRYGTPRNTATPVPTTTPYNGTPTFSPTPTPTLTPTPDDL